MTATSDNKELVLPRGSWDPNLRSLEEADVLHKLAVLRGSADESARHVRGLYFTFLLFAFYVAVIVFSTTDEQLLRETGVRLPLLLWAIWPRLSARSGRWRVWWPIRRRSGERTSTGWPRTRRQRQQMLRVSTGGFGSLIVIVAAALLLVRPGGSIKRFLEDQPRLDRLHRNLVLSGIGSGTTP